MTAKAVSNHTKPGLLFVGGTPGLALHVTESGARSWILRVMIAGKRRDMGLGSFPEVSLAEARETALAARKAVRDGIDPVEQKRQRRSDLAAKRAATMTFDQCADAYITSMEIKWKRAKHTAHWRSSLASYASPIIGSMNVADIDVPHIMRILEPIWYSKTETADRVRGRVEAVLAWATVSKYRHGDNPARWRGHLDKTLPKPSEVARTKNQPALPYAQMYAFMRDLRQIDGMGARALEFAILTACRSGEVRGAKWSEIDRTTKTWVIPAGRMKMQVEHRVPLSEPALSLLDSLAGDGSGYVFPSSKGTVISDMTLSAVVRRMNAGDAGSQWVDPHQDNRPVVPHGFRSTFRNWAAEATKYPPHICEMALAHQTKTDVQAAYDRSDLLAKRVKLMNEWAMHCTTERKQTAKVVPISTAA